MKVTQLRNATVIIEIGTTFGPETILVDPMLAPKSALPGFRFFSGQRRRNPLVEVPAVTDALLNRVSLCLITHCQRGHFDHLDRTGMRFLRDRQTPVICMPRDASYLASQGLL